jgi:hypothetical protein
MRIGAQWDYNSEVPVFYRHTYFIVGKVGLEPTHGSFVSIEVTVFLHNK